MKTIEEIKLYFRISLAKELKTLDKERRKIVRKSLIWGIVFLFAIGIISFASFIYLDMIVAPLILSFLLFAYCWSIIVGLLRKRYDRDFQNNIIIKLLEFVDKDLSYQPHGHISSYFFKKSAIFRRKYSWYKGKDLICGMIDRTSIVSSYLSVNKEGYTVDSWDMPIFSGLLFIVELNKPVTSKIVIAPKAEIQENPILSFPIRMLERWNECDPVIVTDHCEFEKHFVVHGNSLKYTKELLRPELLQAILDFKNKQQSRLFLSFLDSKIFIAIAGPDPFSPRLFSTPLDFEPMKRYFEYLSFCMNLNDIINSATLLSASDGS